MNSKVKGNLVGHYFKGEIKSKGLFLNGYFDIKLPNITKLRPYVGGGIGYSWLTGTQIINVGAHLFDGKYSKKDKDWGWNVGLGLAYQLNQNIDLTLGYRYENLGEVKEQGVSTELKNNKLSLGARYTF